MLPEARPLQAGHGSLVPHVSRPLQLHLLFELLGYTTGGVLYAWLRSRRGDAISDRARLDVIVGAAIGAALGSRLLAWLATPEAAFLSGKTIVGGLLGGLIGVEVTKKVRGITTRTGDLFVLPLIAAMCIGRIGCFLAGPIDHTAGLPSSLPWAIAMGDAVPRHPVALYEIAFLLLLAPIAERFRAPGVKFRVFLASYLAFRLVIDFFKPEPQSIAGGLTAIQWACVAGLVYYALASVRSAAPAEAAA